MYGKPKMVGDKKKNQKLKQKKLKKKLLLDLNQSLNSMRKVEKKEELKKN